MSNWVDREQLRALFKPGDTVYVGGSTNEPHGLLDQLSDLPGLHFIQQPIGVVNQRDLSAIGDNCRQDTFFMTGFLKEGLAAKRVNFIPMHMRAIYTHLAERSIAFSSEGRP